MRDMLLTIVPLRVVCKHILHNCMYGAARDVELLARMSAWPLKQISRGNTRDGPVNSLTNYARDTGVSAVSARGNVHMAPCGGALQRLFSSSVSGYV